MKIFFYNELLRNSDIVDFNNRAIRKHKLPQLYQYFTDIIEKLSDFATDDPDEADYFFIPLFISAWQYENTDPDEFGLISDTCRFLDRGRHILVGIGDFGQRYHSKTEMQSHPLRAYRDKYRWLDDRIVLIALESTDELHRQDVSFFPYMIEPLRPDPRITRSLLCSFKGCPGVTPNFRINTSVGPNWSLMLRNSTRKACIFSVPATLRIRAAIDQGTGAAIHFHIVPRWLWSMVVQAD